jgi:predicted PurR-regulated permease PerM
MKSFSPFSHQDESPPRETSEFQKMRDHSERDAFPFAKAAQIFFIVMGSIVFGYIARPVVLPVLLAWVAAMTLKPPVNWLRACHLPTSLSAAIVIGFFYLFWDLAVCG